MFEKFTQAAERAATSVSRRNFLGQLGRGAAALAAGLGGVLLTARDAHAGPRLGTGPLCCFVGGLSGSGTFCVKGACPEGSLYMTMACKDIGMKCQPQWPSGGGGTGS